MKSKPEQFAPAFAGIHAASLAGIRPRPMTARCQNGRPSTPQQRRLEIPSQVPGRLTMADAYQIGQSVLRLVRSNGFGGHLDPIANTLRLARYP